MAGMENNSAAIVPTSSSVETEGHQYAEQQLQALERQLHDRIISDVPDGPLKQELLTELRSTISGARQHGVSHIRAALASIEQSIEAGIRIAHFESGQHTSNVQTKTYYAERERQRHLVLMEDLRYMLRDDPVFQNMTPEQQHNHLNALAQALDSPEGKAIQERMNNPEYRAQTLQIMQNIDEERQKLRQIARSEEMAPYASRLQAASGQLLGMVTPEIQNLRISYENGNVTPEQYVAHMEAIAQQSASFMGALKSSNLDSMREHDPASARALERHLQRSGISIEQYSSQPWINPRDVSAAYARLGEVGNNLARLSEADQTLIARYQFESRLEVATQFSAVAMVLAQGQSQGLQQEMQGLSPRERAELLVSRGMLEEGLVGAAEALFANNSDEVIWSQRDTKQNLELFDRTVAAYEASFITQRMDAGQKRMNEREQQYDQAIRSVVQQIEASGWGQNVSMDFMVLDKDGDQKLSLDEISRALKDNGVRMRDVDKNNDNQIDAGELARALTPIVEQQIGHKVR